MNYDMLVGFISGANGGVAYVYMSQPLDTVKVKMQMFPTLYNNAFNCFWRTLKKDGIYRGLYAGTAPALVAHTAETAVLFCALEPCKQLVAAACKRSVDELNPLQHGYAGGMAGVVSSVMMCPTELVKCKQQAMREMIEAGRSSLKISDIKPWKICRRIYRSEGIRGFFHGYTPTLFREIIGYFFFFGAYELTSYSFMNFSDKQRKRDDLTLVELAISGAMAGIVSWTSIFPLDVVKSRIQITSGKGVVSHNGFFFIQMLMNIVRYEGVPCLYKGLGPTILTMIPATAALFVAVEYTKRFVHYFYF